MKPRRSRAYARPRVSPERTVTLSVVTVTYESAAAVEVSLPALVAQLQPDDELIVVDNASRDGTVAAVRRLAPAALVVESGENLGFAAGCNLGATHASGELLVFLNPDATPAAGFRAAIERPLRGREGWAAWMGLVTADAGRTVNTAGGVVHFTGISWAGQSGRGVRADEEAGDVGFVSGACLAVPRDVWRREGGFPPRFFMYCEDVDLSLRLRLHGERIGVEPSARVEHDYAFVKGSEKWRLLERNRWATILRTYPTPLLLLLAPALVAAEVAVLAAATAGGWKGAKVASWRETVSELPRLRAERAQIQAGRRVSAAEFADGLVADLSSPYLGRAASLPPLRWALRAYWTGVRAALRRLGL